MAKPKTPEEQKINKITEWRNAGTMNATKQEKKQELIIRISNRTIEVMLEDESASSLYALHHYLDDNTFDNMQDMDDFIKFLAKVLQIVPKDVGDRITKFAFDAVAEALQDKLQKELLNVRSDADGGKNIAIQKKEAKQTAEEQAVFKMIAEEDMKARISYVFGDMKYYEMNNKYYTNEEAGK